ncbi:ABC transporter substrate-binding protein [Streptomyces chumphonensis]|uniref:ABC transporter substrate-binding protein n=1 Tax=Streptomyces chumphonensis TaxID=1214925 RepID=UPI003D723D65
MSTTSADRHRPRRRTRTLLLALALLGTAALAGCGSPDEPSNDKGGQGPLTVGLTYVPNIQFAPFYVAESLGYYEDAGLEVKLKHHSFSEPQFGALSAGREDVVYAGGDEMLQARSKGVPVVDVATLYHEYPVAVMVPKDSPVTEAADLEGRTIGTPGPFGETYFGLLAVLKSAGLSESDVKVQHIGFTQQAALAGGKVDAVTGYLNNDAVQFARSGVDVRTIGPADGDGSLPLVAAGLGASEDLTGDRPEELKALVAATLKGVQYTIDHPEKAVELSAEFVPGLEDPKKRKDALAVLEATIPLMENHDGTPGRNDPAAWERMVEFMHSHDLLSSRLPAEEAFDNSFLP